MLNSYNYSMTASWISCLRCVPSQKGALLVCLQVQRDTSPVFGPLNITGVCLIFKLQRRHKWVPSHQGWFLLYPQAHQRYRLPSTTSTFMGFLALILPLTLFKVAAPVEIPRVLKTSGSRCTIRKDAMAFLKHCTTNVTYISRRVVRATVCSSLEDEFLMVNIRVTFEKDQHRLRKLDSGD